ncbi:bifunctional (p)ppGpp synthetase/guanosine-3',5'-bis(diphosphate) 3'-pyrophosphohydrolase [Candidatus Wolfebacteria bacterium]|nr:bifunctional (p)ppGpp synthetase/guanosine-3',5'-bis(diphosphate) 3'-pyrophosphohydrolase [Candidatus Wolfebacteria bacterium]
MALTPQIEKAIKKASFLHRNQERKRDGTPYISHLFSIAIILLDYIDDENIIVSGILHDTIEDTPYTPDNLEKDFGAKIKEIVLGVTEDKNIKAWEERKVKYRENLKSASFESLMVCVADKIHNLMSLKDAYETYGDDLWKSFECPSPEKYFEYHEAVLKILKEKLNNPIVQKLEEQVSETKFIVLK